MVAVTVRAEAAMEAAVATAPVMVAGFVHALGPQGASRPMQQSRRLLLGRRGGAFGSASHAPECCCKTRRHTLAIPISKKFLVTDIRFEKRARCVLAAARHTRPTACNVASMMAPAWRRPPLAAWLGAFGAPTAHAHMRLRAAALASGAFFTTRSKLSPVAATGALHARCRRRFASE